MKNALAPFDRTFLMIVALHMFIVVAVATAADPATPPATVLAKPDKLLLEDDFERNELGEAWTGSAKSMAIKDGTFVVSQRTDHSHPAVTRVTTEFKDGVVSFRFKFEGSPRFSVVFNDKTYEGSHAGHICRASVTPLNLTLGDDRDGGMKNGVIEKWKDEATKEEVRSIVEGHQHTVPLKLDQDEWHAMTVEIVGDEMAVSLDGKHMARFKSPGFGHAIKNHWGFTVSGQSMAFDNLQLWSVVKKQEN
jgi:hypothetical protein